VVVEAKYDSLSGGWRSKEVAGPFGFGVWKHIRWGWDVFSRYIRYEVGDGSRIHFWHDVWCGDQPLKEAFPEVFSIAHCKEAWVGDNMMSSNGVIQWNVSFVRSVQDWEVDLVLAFFGVLYSLRWRQGSEDCIR
jgi:hypothetical protein